jgi:hypothetical protein
MPFPAYREDRVIPLFDLRYGFSGFDNLAKHLMADDEVLLVRRSARASSGRFFAVRSAYADT